MRVGKLRLITAWPFPEKKIRELYYTVYSRAPDAKEMELALNYLGKPPKEKDEKADPKSRKQLGYEDVIWALINTKEFLFNH